MAEEQDLHEPVSKWKIPVGVFFKDSRRVFKWDMLGKEILQIAFPAALTVAANPVDSLINTAFIGHIGASSFRCGCWNGKASQMLSQT